MSWTVVTSLAIFAFVASITPGPNNLMLMASGANFGLRRTGPHMAGVSLGFPAMILIIGLAFGGLIAAAPQVYGVLRWVSMAYLLWLAWKIATAKGVGGDTAGAKPMTFLQAVAFQWLNPKAWAAALGGVSLYAARDHFAINVVLVATTFAVVGAPSIIGWTAFGLGLKRFLARPRTLRVFNLSMAALLVLSLYPMLTEHFG